MSQQITQFFQRGQRGSLASPVKPRTSSSGSSGPNSALKTLANNRNYPKTRDIAPSFSELAVFCDPKPRKVSDNENSDTFCSSQESTNSSGSTTGVRKLRKQSVKSKEIRSKDEEIQTDLGWSDIELKLNAIQRRVETEEAAAAEDAEALPREALDLFSDEPSDTYYKDLAEARREALADTLEENQTLNELNETLLEDKERLTEELLNASTAHESLKSEMAKMSQLNETLEEENRLLKEALGLNDEDE